MATALKLKNDIKKLKAAINSKATPKTFVPKLKAQLERAEKELADVKSGGKPKRSSAPKTEKTLSALEKLIKRKKFSVYKGAGVDLKKDAGEGAMKTGKRISKGLKSNQWGDKSSNKGNVYYEYRPNRLDVKQPKKRQTYPKLEDGGILSKEDFLDEIYDMAGSIEVVERSSDVQLSTDNRASLNPFIHKFSEFGKAGFGSVSKIDEVEMDGETYYYLRIKYPEMASGGYMAHGGKVEDELYVAELREGEWTVKDKKNPKGNYSLSSKKENAENLRQALIDNPSTLKYYRSNQYEKGGYMANGGKLESGVYRVGKPMKVSQNLYEQKIVEIFDNGDVATASDYGRKISDFKLQKYPMISKEKLDAQYKMASGGSVKSGESVTYIIWVSKDGDKREFHGEYKSKKAADMAMNKLWDSGEYESMGNKPKSMYEKDGLYAKGGYMEHGGEVKFEIDDVVYNKRTNTIGIVRMEDERGETKTDADGNVNTSELEYYNPMNYPNQKDAKVAPSTAKEIDQRMLYQPFKPREMGGYMADGGQIKVGDTITATTGVKVKVVDYDPNFGGRVKVERLDEYATGKPSQWMPLKKFKFESGGYMADGGELHRTQEFAKGGAISHGLKMGDTIVADQFWENSVVVDNPKTGRAVVYLESGKRKESK